MAKKANKTQIGKIAFVVGLILAVLAGLVPAISAYAYTTLIIVILGLVIGYKNVADKNVMSLLVAVIALGVIGKVTLSVIPQIGGYLVDVLSNVVALVGAAGLVVALKVAIATTKA